MPRPRLSADQARRLRVRAQRLTGERPVRVSDVVRAVFAVPAQDLRASRLAIRPRSVGLDLQAVIRACNEERSVVRTWAMRGTLHMVSAEDVTWLVAWLGPLVAAADSRRRLQLGLDDHLLQRALRAMRSVLATSGPLARADLVAHLARRGVKIDRASNAAAHLCLFAAAQGLICRGPDRPDDEPTYVLLEEWVGGHRQGRPKDALAELARRYLAAYGPARPNDLAAWAGIPVVQASSGFDLVASQLVEVEVSGQPHWMLADRQADALDGQRGKKPAVHLLGAFDPYLLGYAARDLALSPAFARRVQAGGGWIHQVVMVDGRVVGTWRQERTTTGLGVEVQPFEALDASLLPLLEAETRDLGRFLGAHAVLPG